MSRRRVRVSHQIFEAMSKRSDAVEIYRDALIELVGFSTCEESRTIARSALEEAGVIPPDPREHESST